MLTLDPPISDAERAVAGFKREQLLNVEAAIILKAIEKTYVHAGDIPEDIVPADDRQGVASGAWNGVVALEIIERLPLNFNDEDRKIFGGRTRNENPLARGRWVAVYRLRSMKLALTWLERNKPSLRPQDAQKQLL